MTNKLKGKKVILLGSGALKIGEAGEFDYSGSQAAKALREEGIKTILINPNIATIQTSYDFVDKVYFLPVNPFFVEKIIIREKPQGILLGFGGQTALNTGLSLWKKGIFSKFKVRVLGTGVKAIEKTEDRRLFRQTIERLGFKVPKSVTCSNLDKVKDASRIVGFPSIVRAGFSLGGLGSGIARDYKQLKSIALKALSTSPQILIEEYLEGWKEIEYEVVRDKDNNAITVCNMENFDPMGIHTGESIVIAPSQTLNNYEYHFLRRVAIDVVKELEIVGECNIQFALDPKSGDYRIIELNARLSRSSALASKATGYPLAYVAAKLALGYKLSHILNQVTRATCAFFEPALDYVVIKVPRWDFLKFRSVKETLIGPEMQSVGEVMAIGRNFEEAFQKAIRSLDLDYEGIISDDIDKDQVYKKNKAKIRLKTLAPTPDRPYNIAFNLFYGQKPSQITKETGIDPWFIKRIKNIISFYKKMLVESVRAKLSRKTLKQAKKLGFSDQQIGEVFGKTSLQIRKLRKKWNILPYVCQIDTLASEFPAKTNYLYFSYHRDNHDIDKLNRKQILVIGGGPYQIGSSVEFDWCAVNTVMQAKRHGFSPIMVNCNPETVSTDYDISDKLYFEELTLERILDIADFEKCPVVVSVGGQIPNTLVPKLARLGIKLLGTSSSSIEKAEDREKFSVLCDRLGIKQPVWRKLRGRKQAIAFAKKIGYPVLVRPSFVLSGRAMIEVYSENEFYQYIKKLKKEIDTDYPLVISKFMQGAKEVDFDAVSQNGKIIVWALSEHVEHAGVHSGDATLVLPSFSISKESIAKIYQNSQRIAQALKINGPFNIQFLVKENSEKRGEVLTIEANLRASRSFPYVSKVLGVNFIKLATKILLGKRVKPVTLSPIEYFGVKAPHFSFTRLRGVDPILRVEMASTGEVASFGDDLYEAYLKAILSTDISYPQKSVLLSIGGREKKKLFLPAARLLSKLGFKIFATRNTYDFLKDNKVSVKFVYKVHEEDRPNVVDLIKDKKVSLVVNISERSDLGMRSFQKAITDGYLIRRAAVDRKIPLFTKATIASLFVESLSMYNEDKLKVKCWGEYVRKVKS